MMPSLSVDGHLPYNSIDSPYWAACNCSANGTISHQKGKYAIGIVKRGEDIAYDVTFPAHPEGKRYMVLISSNEYHFFYRGEISTGLILYLRGSTNLSTAQGDGGFNIAILK